MRTIPAQMSAIFGLKTPQPNFVRDSFGASLGQVRDKCMDKLKIDFDCKRQNLKSVISIACDFHEDYNHIWYQQYFVDTECYEGTLTS